jgi:cation diffusion facilitator family transporter
VNTRPDIRLSRSEQSSRIVRITWIGLGINLVLAGLKLACGLVGRSQAALADAVHSLSDLGSDAALLFGLRLWSAPADARHPYGHRRIETLITMLIGVMLAVVAGGFCIEAVERLRHPPQAPPALIALTGSLLTIFLKEWLFRRTRSAGRSANSPAVIANAWHHRTDALSSIPVVLAVGVSAVRPGWMFLDQAGTLIVAAMIFKAAWGITRPALDELMDTGACQKDVRQIVELAGSVSGIQSVHKVRTRRSGAGLYVDLHALVDGEISVHASHDIATRLQRKLISEGPSVADVVVHIEPGAAS